MPRQHATPVLLESLEQPFRLRPLSRLRHMPKTGDGGFPEKLLQTLIDSHPEMLPVEELEPSFSQLRSVCRELPLGRDESKYLDNLLINAEGRICLYAGEMACLSYEDLSGAVRRACKEGNGDILADRVLGPDVSDFERADFHDAVSRSLRLGNFLLLVVGDGIRAGLQQIAGLLQNRATLGFSLGLVEMAVYAPDTISGPYYVQPRLLLQTEVVTRTVFVAGSERDGTQVEEVGAASKPQTLSEQDFYSALAKSDPSYPDGLRGFLESAQAVGVQPELRRTYILRIELPESDRIGPNLGTISRTGAVEIWLWAAYGRDKNLEPIAREYMERVAAFLGPEAFIKQPKPHDGYVSFQNRASIPLGVMLSHQDAWLAAIQEAVERFHASDRDSDRGTDVQSDVAPTKQDV